MSILLDGEESEMIFIDHPHVEMSVIIINHLIIIAIIISIIQI